MWSILNTPYGLCTLRTTFNWKKKNCANTNHPALKSQLALLLPISALLCLCFLHPHVYMFAVGILHPCLLKIPRATRQPRAGLRSISWITERASTTERGLLWESSSALSLPPFLSEFLSLLFCFLKAELFFYRCHFVQYTRISPIYKFFTGLREKVLWKDFHGLSARSQNFFKMFMNRTLHVKVHCKYINWESIIFFSINVFNHKTSYFSSEFPLERICHRIHL